MLQNEIKITVPRIKAVSVKKIINKLSHSK